MPKDKQQLIFDSKKFGGKKKKRIACVAPHRGWWAKQSEAEQKESGVTVSDSVASSCLDGSWFLNEQGNSAKGLEVWPGCYKARS